MSQYYNDNSQLDNQIEQDKQKHQRTKLTLKICGIVAIVVGLACAVAGMVDFFKAFNSEGEYMPKLFFLCFIGLPLVGVGAACLAFALRGNIARYVKNENMPVVKEIGREITPTVRDIANAVLDDNNVCPYCGTSNDGNAKYCKKCGKAIAKVCPSCGQTVDGDSDFCNHCGKKI